MTKQLRKIWSSVNKVLTFINLLLLGILFGGGSSQKDGKIITVPLWANILLLIVLVSILSLYLLRANSLRDASIPEA